MAGVIAGGREYASLKFEETELRLGLPGDLDSVKSSGKRGFSETVDLELNLPARAAKETMAGLQGEKLVMTSGNVNKEKNLLGGGADPAKPSAPKAQVVGWPPVRSFRKNILAVQSTKNCGNEASEKSSGTSAAFVKVSMDGAPYLRKVDLKMYKSYQELSNALEKMFGSFTSGNCGSQEMNGIRDFMNESKLMDLLNGSEYVPTYEDKDGDWMLVGDVPWEMFVDSCKRLRIMKGSEAIGLAPRAMEKCKNRS